LICGPCGIGAGRQMFIGAGRQICGIGTEDMRDRYA